MDQNKKSYWALLKKHKKEKNWDAMLVSAQEAVNVFPKSNRFWRALHYAQSHYVDEKLKSDLVHELETREAYEELHQVYLRLETVFPDSAKLKRRIKHVRLALSAKKIKEQEQYLKAAENKIQDLAKQNLVDEALQASYEVLAQIPDHKFCLKMNQTLLKKRENAINKEIGEFFKKSYDLVSQEYKGNKDAILKI